MWEQWDTFCLELATDPFLQAFQNKIPLLQVFAQRVRTGSLARDGNPLRARSVEDYVRHVAQTFLAVGSKDPRLNSANDIDFTLRRMFKAWKKEDPPPKRVKPVPVQVIRRIAFIAQHSNCEHQKAIADMIILAFFFLLRPGEYTDTSTRTRNPDKAPFRLGDVQLFVGNTRLDILRAPAAVLLTATFASLTFDDQKNSVRGEVIGLATSGDPYLCPVKSLVRRILHIRPNVTHHDVPLARVWLRTSTTSVRPKDITATLRQAVTFLGPELGFLSSDVSARCLRASGANALLNSNVDTDIISLIGRWRSDEMLRYLHVQNRELMKDYSHLMLSGGAYTLIPNQQVPMH